MVTDAEVLERIRQGGLIESVDEMSETYREALRVTLVVSGDTELLSAPAYYHAAQKAPSVNAYISLMAIIQDELGHAHIAYRILE
ncbi:MAG: phenylacetate-CoA oxygenase subunit PaaI, partial [Acidobacteria bacterium]|nr:phenylacetate-CoA oxygenase subunit PaaI [Acidobacteriota bacterium]MDW7983926.1 Phenylacetic acid catabolic protein [Acidobacteriota bacterium]